MTTEAPSLPIAGQVDEWLDYADCIIVLMDGRVQYIEETK